MGFDSEKVSPLVVGFDYETRDRIRGIAAEHKISQAKVVRVIVKRSLSWIDCGVFDVRLFDKK